jgi:Bacterial Ig-like domain (group 1)
MPMTKLIRWATALSVAASIAFMAGCGGGSGAGAQGSNSSAGGSNATEMSVSSDRPTLDSDGRAAATITVQVKDGNNNALANQPVTVATTDAGTTISAAPSRTDANGNLTRTISISDKSNRIVTLTVTSGALVRTFTIPVVGTQMSINGPTAVGPGSAAAFTLVLRDSNGAPISGKSITVTSSAGNVITSSPVNTNASGQASFSVTGNASDTITASGAGASATASFTVAPNSLTFESPANLAELTVSTNHTITVRLQRSTGSVVNQTLRYNATRPQVSADVQTDATGRATFSLNAASAGLSTVSISLVEGGVTTATATQRFEFVSRTPDRMSLQASPSVVGVNLGGSTANTIQLIAAVRDATNNPVKGVRVNFGATADPSNGSIDPAFAITDSSGIATASFIAGPNSSGNNAVQLRAVLDGNASIFANAQATVAQQSLVVRIGTGRTITAPDDTKYRMPWTAVVTDSAGNPVSNAQVTAAVTYVAYRKGTWVLVTSTPGGTPTGWGQNITATCNSEDVNRSGTLDPGEDINGNSTLEPGTVGSVLVLNGGLTNTSGFADFQVEYPKNFSQWTQAFVTVTTAVGGTEGSTSSTFWLPILAEDVRDTTTAPPGQISPFGQAGSCTAAN